MKIKKIVSLLLISAMSFSLLAGCGKKEAADTDIKEDTQTESQVSDVQSSEEADETEEQDKITFPLEEPITVTAFLSTYKIEPGQLEAWKRMEELTNVHFEFVTAQVYGEDREKINLMMSSDTYPEVIIGMFNSAEAAEYGDQGMLIPLQDLMAKYSPNYMAVAEQRPDVWKATKDDAGNVYSYGRMLTPRVWNYFFTINTQWLENLGLDMPETTEEYLEVLRAFKNEDADGDGDPNNEIPLLLYDKSVHYIAEFFGVQYGNYNGGELNTMAFSEDGNDCYFYPADSRWKEALSFVKQLYDEELINRDYITMSQDQAIALGASGQAFGSTHAYSMNAAGADGADSLRAQYEPMPILNGANIAGSGETTEGGVFVITDKCEHPEIMAAWVDLFYDQAEFSRMATMGMEDVHYTVNEDGLYSWTEFRSTGDEGLSPGVAFPSVQDAFRFESQYIDPETKPYTYAENEFYKMYRESGKVYTYPDITYNEDEVERVADIRADMSPYASQFATQVIAGEIDLEAEWDNYIEQLKEMGLDEYNEIINAAYDRSE